MGAVAPRVEMGEVPVPEIRTLHVKMGIVAREPAPEPKLWGTCHGLRHGSVTVPSFADEQHDDGNEAVHDSTDEAILKPQK